MWLASKEGEFRSDLIRLYPVTSQTIDQQLDDVIAAIRGFTTQAPARSDFQHLMALPTDGSWNELPKLSTQSSVQAPVLEVRPPLPVCPPAAGLHQTQYFAVSDDVYCYKGEDLAADSPPAQGYGYGLASSVSPLPLASP